MLEFTDEMNNKIARFSRTVVDLSIDFGSRSFPAGTDYHASHNAIISAMIMSLAKIISGTLADPEDVLDIAIKQLRSKEIRGYIARERAVFIKTLANHGKELRHGKPPAASRPGQT